MSQSESYEYLIFWITGSFLNRCLGTLDCSRALLTRNSRGPSRTVLDFDLKGEIPMFCLVLWLVPLLSISSSRTVDSVRDTRCPCPLDSLPDSSESSQRWTNGEERDKSKYKAKYGNSAFQAKVKNGPGQTVGIPRRQG